MTANVLNATKMLLGFDQFFFAKLHFAINPRTGSIFVIFF